jgi:L-alanine-DL-glutamate epimerase-like enolase superfamily enzyme
VHATAERLATLPLVVDDVQVRSASVPLAAYPGARRPHSVVTLTGDGRAGVGEHVGWSDAEHAAFAQTAAAAPRGRWQLGAWSAALAGTPYDRAALEAAALDLALRQRGTSLFALAGVAPRPVRYVVSFARTADPVAEAERHPGAELKVDVDPAWDERVWRGLAALGRVAVLDFKGAAGAARAHRWLPAALLEDAADPIAPWASFDAPLRSAAALDRLPVRPAAVNLKPARMGGVLEVLRLAARCAAAGIAMYLGGMFEAGVGRRQLHVLAALLCPEGPNDVAPLSGPRPARLAVDAAAPGFGGDLARAPAAC